jgi:hypothetical protein
MMHIYSLSMDVRCNKSWEANLLCENPHKNDNFHAVGDDETGRPAGPGRRSFMRLPSFQDTGFSAYAAAGVR